MLSIGAFARIGQVSHRMLRHWDAAGLLVPARVDEFTGFRSYDPSQLERLHRIVALRQLGFGLEDVAGFLEAGVDAARVESLLRARRADVERDYRLAAARLVDVEHRLRLIERENHMSIVEIIEKSLPSLRLAAGTAVVQDQSEVAGVVGPLFDRVAAVIGSAPGALETPVAQYDMSEEGLRITAGYVYTGEPREGVEIVELPPVGRSVCGVHLGEMSRIAETWQAIHSEAIARGLAPSGPCRELYVRADGEDQSNWVTELQQPVAPV
ncbi:MerR family transcriptional regulator [Zhihengliuella halotolerans]|uniref:DNA-binding transcriptional MerR regulator n=1 Tax=Zhihengliuella halotolerans TaxID=370736 RepID=A0A4Q8AHU1_9MICC|nr:MerR family transcriptional regulator [Zhihengliuella halotolerans]RZU63481.1 DNA-binding transcriptional MerR regulator [Zhihengliuella halotolerans]